MADNSESAANIRAVWKRHKLIDARISRQVWDELDAAIRADERAKRTCATCRWAEAFDSMPYARNRDGTLDEDMVSDRKRPLLKFTLACARAEMDESAEVINQTLAMTQDGSDYKGSLLVVPEFGCVMHEAKP